MSDTSQNRENKPIIGISIGDFNGIGPEVVIKALNDNRILRHLTPVIYADGRVISFTENNSTFRISLTIRLKASRAFISGR